ncbi:hypothetical protein V2J09_024186 [Rumex salicifolius]
MPPCISLSPTAGLMVSDFSTERPLSPAEAAALLKRKRPARIHIPMPTFTTVPETTILKRAEELEEEGDGYAVYCRRGKKGDLEDRFSASVEVNGAAKQALFGVFDGHGGATAAEFAAKNLGRKILEKAQNTEELENAVRDGYLTTDSDYLKQKAAGGGACSVTALIRDGNLVVSNAGDCRAVLCRSGVAVPLTIDHKPSREDERQRIEATGGYVDCCRGVWRIQSSLAVSRAIGDMHLKQWVTAEPETKSVAIQPDFQFLILASDGVWDKVSNQEAVDIVLLSCTEVGSNKPDLAQACRELVNLSIKRGSYDDTSALLVDFGRFVA